MNINKRHRSAWFDYKVKQPFPNALTSGVGLSAAINREYLKTKYENQTSTLTLGISYIKSNNN